MNEITKLEHFVEPKVFLKRAMTAATTADIEALLSELPIVPDNEYTFNSSGSGWSAGKFHWIPVGLDRGNAGRIRLANKPINPIAERLINGMEALIELMRQKELLNDTEKESPKSPREAIRRYFGLPSLDQLPKLEERNRKDLQNIARDLARKLRIRLFRDKDSGEFTVAIEDDGIGQSPENMHKTLLSLGATTKGDKPYLIGVFGQGGSSAYSACECSWIMSRRAPDVHNNHNDGVGWTIVRHIFPKGRRDGYFAYLAAHPDGYVPFFSKSVAEEVGISHGSRFVHVGYDFGKGGSQIVRQLYPALNHLLFNPIIPYELYAARDSADLMNGNAYRLSLLSVRGPKPILDKNFYAQPVGD